MIGKTMFVCVLFIGILQAQSPRIISCGTSASGSDRVTVLFKVVDPSGLPIENLQRDSVTVRDNDTRVANFDFVYRPTVIHDRTYIVLVLDASGSMHSNHKIDKMKRSAISVVDGMAKDDECAILEFSSQPKLLTGFTDDRMLLKEKILSITPGGYTAIYDAVFEALNQLEAQPADAGKNILLISDGTEEGQSLFSLSDIAPRIFQMKNLTIHTFDLNEKHEVNELRRLAGMSGGSYTYANSTDGVFSAFAHFLERNRKTYAVSYVPPSGADEHDHTVTLGLTLGGVSQQFQTSYVQIEPTSASLVSGTKGYYFLSGILVLAAAFAISLVVMRKKRPRSFTTDGLVRHREEPRIVASPLLTSQPEERTRVFGYRVNEDHERTIILDDPKRRSADLGYLITEGPGGTRETIELEAAEILIGRSAQCRVQFPDPSVSRLHAKIRREKDTFVIYDLGSANGTFVNGEEIQKRALKDNDIIEVGKYRMTYDGGAREREERV